MFAEIVFPLPFRNSFTYAIPEEFKTIAVQGVRAAAPFGKRILTGFIINTQKTAQLEGTIKQISDVLDDEPIFNKTDLEFYKWISEYYLCSLGEALKLAFPYGSDIESKRKIISHEETLEKLLQKGKKRSSGNSSSLKRKILEILLQKDELSFSRLQKLAGKKNIYSIIKSLEKLEAVTVLTNIEEPRVKVKTGNFVKLTKSALEIYEVIPEIENRSPKQVGILLDLISKKNKPQPLPALLKRTKSTKSSVNSLEQKGLVEIFEAEIERKYDHGYHEELSKIKITTQQNEIVKTISEKIDKEEFHCFLIHGVTGSGKTQVYIELIKKTLVQKKTALILVPEISLTPQITSRLYNNFGEAVSVIHSRMSLGERYDSWRKILKGKSSVVIGARSALFSPLKNLGIIVIDEEHDQSYKQFESVPKYNARDSAIVLAKLNNCPVVLGSATPSVESMYNARNGKYTLQNLPERIDNAKLPRMNLVNVISAKKKKKMQNIFSVALLDKIEERLKKEEGIIILQNRRGFSTQIYCEDCGEIETCDNCSVSMVFHINKNILQCHYCGFMKKTPRACSNCGSISLKYFGAGTERVEDEIEYYFPKARTARVDSDSVSRKNSLSKTLQEFSEGRIDILVGTQMVSKGLDFPRVTLVGVISAETTLWLPDFRADERTFQLLTQVAGRAGRSKIEGEVVIQTQNEENFTLQKVLQNDYEGFYQKEIYEREKAGYPPFTRLALIETRDLNEEKSKGAVSDFYKELLNYKKWLKITPPSTALIARLKGFYRFHIMIKSSKEVDPGGAILRQAVLNSFIEFNRKSRYSNVKLTYDVDPQSVL